jgi:hypothetical protein
VVCNGAFSQGSTHSKTQGVWQCFLTALNQEIVIDIVAQAFDFEFDNPVKLPAPAFGDGDRVMR